MNHLMMVDRSAVPQARSWNVASSRKRAIHSVATARGGSSRLCGGKPSHDTTDIDRSIHGWWIAWSRIVIARSIASSRLRRTRAVSTAKPAMPDTMTARAPRVRGTATEAGTGSRRTAARALTRPRSSPWTPGCGTTLAGSANASLLDQSPSRTRTPARDGLEPSPAEPVVVTEERFDLVEEPSDRGRLS